MKKDSSGSLPKYRKKPVVVEAVHLPEPGVLFLPGTKDDYPDWLMNEVRELDGCVVGEIDTRRQTLTVKINTLEGEMIVSPGDWIIRGVNGELYPCKPDIFEKTYEKVDDVCNT